MASIYDVPVKCSECGDVSVPTPPNHRWKVVIAMIIVFATIGFAFGAVAGVATAGVGFVAWIFTLPIGIYAGYKIGVIVAELIDGPSCPGCDSGHGASVLIPF